MLLIVTALTAFLVNTYGISFRDCFGCIMSPEHEIVLAENPEVNSTLVRLNKRWNSKVVWDEKLTKKALKAAEGSYKGRAFVVRKVKKYSMSERNETTLAQKVEGALAKKLRKSEIILHALPVASRYGCNGIYDMEDSQDVLTVVCLYKAAKRSRA